MSEVNSFAQPKDNLDTFYACGFKWVDPTEKKFKLASTMKFKTDSPVDYLHVWGDSKTSDDACKAVAFDDLK